MMDANSSFQERQNMFNLSKREKKKIYLHNCNLLNINEWVYITKIRSEEFSEKQNLHNCKTNSIKYISIAILQYYCKIKIHKKQRRVCLFWRKFYIRLKNNIIILKYNDVPLLRHISPRTLWMNKNIFRTL